jgi:hypothetical protein
MPIVTVLEGVEADANFIDEPDELSCHVACDEPTIRIQAALNCVCLVGAAQAAEEIEEIGA